MCITEQLSNCILLLFQSSLNWAFPYGQYYSQFSNEKQILRECLIIYILYILLNMDFLRLTFLSIYFLLRLQSHNLIPPSKLRTSFHNLAEKFAFLPKGLGRTEKPCLFINKCLQTRKKKIKLILIVPVDSYEKSEDSFLLEKTISNYLLIALDAYLK